MPDTAFDLLDAIEDYVARAVAPLRARIAELDAQLAARPLPEKGNDGFDGKDAEPVDYDRIGAMLKAMVATVPAGRDGVDGVAGKDGAAGRDGVDAAFDYDALAAMVTKAVAAIPPGRDGRDGIDGKDGLPGERGIDGAPGKDGAPGRDGTDATGAPGRDGIDGAPGERGIDGTHGRDGIDGTPGERGTDGEKGIDGRDGRDAIDGLVGIKADLENERDLVVSFLRSNGVRTTLRAVLPIPIFRGVHQDGRAYLRGDNVTKNGCQWTCVADTSATPPSPDWVQSTKAGRDAR